MIKKYNILALLFLPLLSFSDQAFAHGEDVAGPHGGFIRMPGNFHTELVQDGPSVLKVYLLDINWKNPTIVKSTVSAKFSIKGKTIDLTCNAKSDYFECTGDKVNFSKRGTVKIIANRMENEGGDAVYELPLKLKR